MAAWVAPLISGGLSLISGLFGASSANKANKKAAAAQAAEQARIENRAQRIANDLRSNPVNVGAMMADAETAGFNPVTWLRGGALSVYSNAHAASVEAGSPHLGMASQVAVPSIGEVFSNAAGSAFNVWNADRIRSQDADLSRELLQTQIGASERAAQAARAFTVAGRTQRGGAELSAGLPGPREAMAPTLTNPHQYWRIDPTLADAESWEAHYGEIGGLVGGTTNWFNNLWYNTTGLTRNERREAAVNAPRRWIDSWLPGWLSRPVYGDFRDEALRRYDSGETGW